MSQQLMNKIKDMQQEINLLRRRIEQRPLILGTSASVKYRTVVIDRGNILETGQHGIKFETVVTSVPSAYDPNVTSSFIDGIGRGTLYVNGVVQDGYVVVVNDWSGTFQNALVNGDPIFAGGPISIDVDGGGTVKAYTAG